MTPGVPLPDGVGDGRVAARILVARLLAMLPFGAALAVGTATIVSATYRELTLPGDAVTPIAWRVLRSVPLTVLLLLVTWLLGESRAGSRHAGSCSTSNTPFHVSPSTFSIVPDLREDKEAII